ncbi:hypothetical protein BD309DRAFT_1050285, partial [Dichomitus squalens]
LADFNQAFLNLRRRFTERGVFEMEMKLAILEDIHTTVDLHGLAHVRSAGLNSGKACLEGTRRKTLDELISWINNPDAARVRFLLGGAGTGKSSVAHSIGVYFKALRRLGSFFCFDRAFQGDRHPETVFSTIARDLANWNSDFRRTLAEVLRGQRELGEFKDIAAQWEWLIVKPLQQVSLVGPVLIVIDAFDECSSDARSRRLLLKHLTEGSAHLPSNVRVLITSRSEPDVKRVVNRHGVHPHTSHVILDDDHTEAAVDIKHYLRHELAPVDPETEAALDDTYIQKLADKAEGLFQWAATACRIILEKPSGRTLKERFDSRLGAVLSGGASSLDDLYRGILEQLFDSSDEGLMERFCSVMAQILCASSPLSVQSLDEKRRLATGAQEEANLILADMGSLLMGVYKQTTPIRPHHTSFRDFLIDEDRSQKWFVDLSKGHPVMALGCFRVMNKHPSFNICRMDTSYLPNCDIPDLEARLREFVPGSLSYAACS